MSKRKTDNKGAAVVSTVSAGALITLLAFSPTKELKPPKVYPGPYFAHVTKITDSDTYGVLVHSWPGESKTTAVRVYGIDTPEKFRPKCDLEKQKALEATKFVEDRVKVGSVIELTDVFFGKFAGRIVAKVKYENFKGEFQNVGNDLIKAQFAVPYFGKAKVKDWCSE